MGNNFTDLSIPDPNTRYSYDGGISTGFTHLMKLVLMIEKDPKEIESIKQIINTDPDQINCQNSNGFTALMLACNKCNNELKLSCVKLLLNAGADTNLVNDNKYTALMLTCLNYDNESSLSCVKLLIKSGANVNCVSIDGQTALMFKCRKYDNELHLKCIKLLIKSGANANLQNNSNDTALIIYCRSRDVTLDRSLKVLMLLISKTLDVTANNECDLSAYDYYIRSVIDPKFVEGHSYTKSASPQMPIEEHSITNELVEILLKGTIKLSNTKSARSLS